MLGHPSADAPYIANLAGLQQSITARRISNIQHAPSLSLPFLRAVVGQLRKRLRSADTHAYGDARAAQYPSTHLAPNAHQVTRYPGQVSEAFVDAVHLDGGCHLLKESHDPLTHVTVQRVVAGERANTQALKLVPNLEVGLSHGDMRLGIRAARDDAAVVVSE